MYLPDHPAMLDERLSGDLDVNTFSGNGTFVSESLSSKYVFVFTIEIGQY
jgi:hypothetical protein